MRKSYRGSFAAKTDRQALGLYKGMGSGFVQIPASNQYRGHREVSSLAKASHWGNLRRQSLSSSEMRVGRTAVIDGIVAKNGYGDVLPL